MKKNKGPSQRQLRVGELVRHALMDVLAREQLDDPVLASAMITISEVRMTADLKIANCYVSLLGGGDMEAVLKALGRAEGFLRGRSGPHLSQMRSMPTFRFREDTSFENFARIDALLKSDAVKRDLVEPEENRPDIRLEGRSSKRLDRKDG
ncbi:30S ribosome-binding factor RbfA [Ahrensia sp. R2A130]|uniref:30S ribosome-binding factor RbfA n=1 Tax=Ahrensia sp. R2A130 TaxID=744979 RepID=UPI0001E0BC64|nr:30S ribosome-binding factor RbfA [Ahrensia sp. R2A130]EFL89760.1 ribosome-binding factor A [Ahrensia sp. R2A130]